MLDENHHKSKTRFYVACAFVVASLLFVDGDLTISILGSDFSIPSTQLKLVLSLVFAAAATPMLIGLVSGVANFSIGSLTKPANLRLTETIKREEELTVDGAVRALNDIIEFLNDDWYPDDFPMPFEDGSREYRNLDVFDFKGDLEAQGHRITAYLDLNPNHDAEGYRQERRKWLLPLLRKHYPLLSNTQAEWVIERMIRHIDDEYRENYTEIGKEIVKQKCRLRLYRVTLAALVVLNDFVAPILVGIFTLGLLTNLVGLE